MATQAEDVYATLLLNDSYLPGALVLAHSLRDAGTSKKLAVLVTTDSVSADAMAQLQVLFDFIVPVERIVNNTQANLLLMDRIDLHSTFTKITLWKQIQFRRIVYMDADMVALRAPDELFNLPQPFSAAPDIGWPDLFNSGLMVLNPNMGDYYALLAMAQRGISFDGADQGLLNMHFKNTYNRLSFTYNVTPSAHYQYLPAYRHFQSSISAAHFIGKNKPWTEGRDAHQTSNPYDEMVGRWWAVYDRHYRESSATISGNSVPFIVQKHVQGEFVPVSSYVYNSEAPPPTETEREIPIASEIILPLPLPLPLPVESQQPENSERIENVEEAKSPPAQEQERKEFRAPFTAWDPSRAPPPADSRPEASNFPDTHYDMSSDVTPFKAPDRYPEPPTGMYYEVPKTPTYQKPAPIFPWEKDAPKPTRVFAEDNDYRPSSSGSAAIREEEKDEPVTPTTPTISITTADPWQSFNSRTNAWDDIPEIERYIGALQKNRKGNIQVLQGYGAGIAQVSSPGGRRPSMKLTDFPTELERPSLPVTPAPVRRPSFWGEERDEEGELPAAEGVPAQADWDPAAQLEMLARRQSDVLANKLGHGEEREIPDRPLPYGSEGVKSPTYRPQAPGQHMSAQEAEALSESQPRMEMPSFAGPGAMWEKDETYPHAEPPLGPSEEEKDVLET